MGRVMPFLSTSRWILAEREKVSEVESLVDGGIYSVTVLPLAMFFKTPELPVVSTVFASSSLIASLACVLKQKVEEDRCHRVRSNDDETGRLITTLTN